MHRVTFLYHHVEVEDGDEEHEVPEHHEDGHQAEQQPHYRRPGRVLRPEIRNKIRLNPLVFHVTFDGDIIDIFIFSPQETEFVILQFGQRRICSVIVVVDSSVLLIADEILDLLPAEVSLPLLVHHCKYYLALRILHCARPHRGCRR